MITAREIYLERVRVWSKVRDKKIPKEDLEEYDKKIFQEMSENNENNN